MLTSLVFGAASAEVPATDATWTLQLSDAERQSTRHIRVARDGVTNLDEAAPDADEPITIEFSPDDLGVIEITRTDDDGEAHIDHIYRGDFNAGQRRLQDLAASYRMSLNPPAQHAAHHAVARFAMQWPLLRGPVAIDLPVTSERVRLFALVERELTFMMSAAAFERPRGPVPCMIPDPDAQQSGRDFLTFWYLRPEPVFVTDPSAPTRPERGIVVWLDDIQSVDGAETLDNALMTLLDGGADIPETVIVPVRGLEQPWRIEDIDAILEWSLDNLPMIDRGKIEFKTRGREAGEAAEQWAERQESQPEAK